MASERLPIKFFQKRKKDVLRVEGGGKREPPKFALDSQELEIRAKQYSAVLETFRSDLIEKANANSIVPVVLEAQMHHDAKAKTHRSKIRDLFRGRYGNNVVGMTEDEKLVVKMASPQDVDIVLDRLSEPEKYSHPISAVVDLSRYEPQIIRGDDRESAGYKIKLIDFKDQILNSRIQDMFEKSVLDTGISLDKTNYTRDLVVYRIPESNLDHLLSLQTEEIFETIYTIEPMPKYTVSLDMMNGQEHVPIKRPKEGREYPIVGVLDSGIADVPNLKPWLMEDSFTVYPGSVMNREHGTFVAGIVTYGDDLEDASWISHQGVRVLDACIMPDPRKETVTEDEFVSNIREAISRYHHEVKVWNLSASIMREVSDTSFSDFAAALDDIQDRYDVLICKSAGNCSNFVRGEKPGKINEGADSVRAITVGSLAHEKSTSDFGELHHPSPFSRVGRGPSYIIKPEVVHYGGNAGVSANGEILHTGVRSFGLDGNVQRMSGTSFSTPRIAALAAGLTQEISQNFDSLLVRALIIHSAMYSDTLSIEEAKRADQMGFGCPANIPEILSNGPHEMTLILRDELLRGSYIDMMDFPMPECLIMDGHYTGQITLTLVANPLLDQAQRSEYCQSDIEEKFGTYDHLKYRETAGTNLLNPVGRAGTQNLLLKSLYSTKRFQKDDDFALRERMLIKYGDKFYPVKKYAVDLADLTPANRRDAIKGDKSWYLYLRCLFRDHIEVMHSANPSELKSEFCLIVTVKDPTETKPVYNEMVQKLNEFNFVHSNLETRIDIDVGLDGL